MNNPSFIIFDVDDTLLDFGRAFYLAQQAMAGLLGQEYSPEYCHSLSNDILGAKVAGLRTCWYNIKNKPAPEDCAADYIITAIGQLTGLLL